MDVLNIIEQYENLLVLVTGMLELELEDWQHSCGGVSVDDMRKEFTLTYNYDTGCECCGCSFGEISKSFDEVQEALSGGIE